jgi:hypothetical protein
MNPMVTGGGSGSIWGYGGQLDDNIKTPWPLVVVEALYGDMGGNLVIT